MTALNGTLARSLEGGYGLSFRPFPNTNKGPENSTSPPFASPYTLRGTLPAAAQLSAQDHRTQAEASGFTAYDGMMANLGEVGTLRESLLILIRTSWPRPRKKLAGRVHTP